MLSWYGWYGCWTELHWWPVELSRWSVDTVGFWSRIIWGYGMWFIGRYQKQVASNRWEASDNYQMIWTSIPLNEWYWTCWGVCNRSTPPPAPETAVHTPTLQTTKARTKILPIENKQRTNNTNNYIEQIVTSTVTHGSNGGNGSPKVVRWRQLPRSASGCPCMVDLNMCKGCMGKALAPWQIVNSMAVRVGKVIENPGEVAVVLKENGKECGG